jgi:hypothetical protein
LNKCIEEDFSQFHKNLKFNNNKTRLIDGYGFEFPHDYPLTNMNNIEYNNIGEGVFGEENGVYIIDNYMDYYDNVLDKYNRRIERFKNIVNDTNPIIVLCRYSTRDVLNLQKMFSKYFKKENVYFINSTYENFENDKIKNIYTEINGIWNDTNIWNQYINEIIIKIKSTYI